MTKNAMKLVIEEAKKEEIKQEIKTEMTAEEKAKRKEELKAKYRRPEMAYSGRLYIDQKTKKPGKVYRIDDDTPAQKAYLESLGYRVCVDTEVKTGGTSLSHANGMEGSVHRFEQSVYGQSQPGILYEIDQDEYEARKEVEAENNDKRLLDEIDAASREDQKASNRRK